MRSLHKSPATLIGVVLVLLACLPAFAEPINVLTVNENATGIYLPADHFNFTTGAAYTVVRNELLNPANFGPSGVISRSISLLTPVDVITPAALTDVDVVVLAPWMNITPVRRQHSVSFVQSGGGLLAARQSTTRATLQL